MRTAPGDRPPRRPLTSPEVAEAVGVDVSTICRWARDGHLPYLRKLPGLRGAYLFDPSVKATARARSAADNPPGAVH
jgi:excisionase family DNA binding protein